MRYPTRQRRDQHDFSPPSVGDEYFKTFLFHLKKFVIYTKGPASYCDDITLLAGKMKLKIRSRQIFLMQFDKAAVPTCVTSPGISFLLQALSLFVIPGLLKLNFVK